MNDWLHKEMRKAAAAQKTGSFYTNILSSSCYVQPSMTRWMEVRNKGLITCGQSDEGAPCAIYDDCNGGMVAMHRMEMHSQPK